MQVEDLKRGDLVLYILEHFTVNWREGGDSKEYHVGTSLMNLRDALTEALDNLEDHNKHERWYDDAQTEEEYEERVERWEGRDGEDENGLLELLMEVQGDGYGLDNLNYYSLIKKEPPVLLKGSTSEYDAESFEAQIGYQGARDFVSTMKGRVEGANKEGYFPADEEDFQEFVLDTMEDHIDLADWMERHGAEEVGCDWVQIGHGNHPTKMSYIWYCEKLNARIDSIKKPSTNRKVRPNSFTQNWKHGKESHYFGAEGEGMSLKESAKVGFGLGAGLLGFRIVALTGAVALGALLSRR